MKNTSARVHPARNAGREPRTRRVKPGKPRLCRRNFEDLVEQGFRPRGVCTLLLIRNKEASSTRRLEFSAQGYTYVGEFHVGDGWHTVTVPSDRDFGVVQHQAWVKHFDVYAWHIRDYYRPKRRPTRLSYVAALLLGGGGI